MYDPMGARFRQPKLEDWQITPKTFDFDHGFVKHVRSYLAERKLPAEATDAKAWINKGFFNLERYELIQLQWETYVQKRDRIGAGTSTATESLADVADGAGDQPTQQPMTGEQRAANLRRLREMSKNIGVSDVVRKAT